MLISQPNLKGFVFCKKKHLNASVLPQFLSTHLTSSFNFRKVQIWPRTFPLCTVTYYKICQVLLTLMNNNLRKLLHFTIIYSLNSVIHDKFEMSWIVSPLFRSPNTQPTSSYCQLKYLINHVCSNIREILQFRWLSKIIFIMQLGWLLTEKAGGWWYIS